MAPPTAQPFNESFEVMTANPDTLRPSGVQPRPIVSDGIWTTKCYQHFWAVWILLMACILVANNMFPGELVQGYPGSANAAYRGTLIGVLILVFVPAAVYIFFMLRRYQYSTSFRQFMFIFLETCCLMIPFVFFLEYVYAPYVASPLVHAMIELFRPMGVGFLLVCNAFVSAFVIAGFTEEMFKYMTIRRLLFSSRAADASSVIVYGFAAGFAFAFLENVDYCLDPVNHRNTYDAKWEYGNWSIAQQTATLRLMTALPIHAAFGIMTAAGLGRAKFLGEGKASVMAIAPAVFWHGLYDFLLMAAPGVQAMGLDVVAAMMPFTSLFILVPLIMYKARAALLQLQDVAVVDIHACMRDGLVSQPKFSCCEQNAISGTTAMTQRRSFDGLPGAEQLDYTGVVTRAHKCVCGQTVRAHVVLPSHCPHCFVEIGRKQTV